MKPTRPVLVLGGSGRSGTVATHIAGDLSDAGLPAVLVTVEQFLAGNRDDSAGVIVVHTSKTRWPEKVFETLVARRGPGHPVAIARADSSRLPPLLHGFPGLFLIPGQSYPPSRQESGGYEHLFTILGKRPKRRSPAVFLSYSRADVAFLGDLASFLRDRRIPAFDYLYTERLDTAILPAELERCVVAGTALLVVATPQWRLSRWCVLELDVARKHHKPIVAVWPPGVGRHHAPQLGEDVPVVSFGRDVDAAGKRLMSALTRILP